LFAGISLYFNIAILRLLGPKKLAAVGVYVFKEAAEQVFVLFPDLGIDAVGYAGAFDGALDDPGVFQLFEVLGGGGLGKAEFFYQAAGDAGVLFHQVLQDGDPRRVRDGLGHVGYVVLLFGEEIRFCGAHIVYLIIAILRYSFQKTKFMCTTGTKDWKQAIPLLP
jgi:hypothetical protein